MNAVLAFIFSLHQHTHAAEQVREQIGIQVLLLREQCFHALALLRDGKASRAVLSNDREHMLLGEATRVFLTYVHERPNDTNVTLTANSKQPQA